MAEEVLKKKILVVDDEAGSALLVKASLVKQGFDVIQAGNGLEALLAVKGQVPDLVVMDRMMPKMDGMKACALIKLDRRFSGIPVIMLTASADKADVKMSEEVGAEAFLNKPVNVLELIQKVQELLTRS